MKNCLIVIPAYDPNENLVQYVKDLIAHGFSSLLIIDDGSKEETKPIFDKLALLEEVDMIRHSVNLGKGRALKNAINYFLNHYEKKGWEGLITVDSDGQHAISDVKRIYQKLNRSSNMLCLGVRDFNQKNVPFKSKFGNTLTKKMFGLLYGKKVTDTQTGLRGLSKDVLYHFIALNGERFNYETNMLIEAVRHEVDFSEVTIETIYIDDNSETHFRPIADSVQIYGLLFANFIKYMWISLFSFVIDISLFRLFILMFGYLAIGPRIGVATIGARLLSSMFNYTANKYAVFNSKKSVKSTFINYYLLMLFQLTVSWLSVYLIYRSTGYPEANIKILVDLVLFFISYRIQRGWVF